MFTGDALGIHPPDARSLRPATPPPEYDLELAIGSIERIRERALGAIVLFSHFGPVHEVERICDLATERFRTWTEAVGRALDRGLDPNRNDALDEVMRVLKDVARTDAPTGAEAELDLQAMEMMSSIRLNSMGILGYWQRRREAEGSGQAS